MGRPPVSRVAVNGLFLLALVVAIDQAQSFFLPLILAVLLAFVLQRPVRTLVRIGLPIGLSSALVLILLLGAAGFGVYKLKDPALEWISEAPASFSQLERKLRRIREPVQQVTAAADQVEKITELEQEQPTRQVEIKEESLASSLMAGAGTLLIGAASTIALLFLFLVYGERLMGRVLALLPGIEEGRGALLLAGTIEKRVSKYLFTISMINIGLAVAQGLAMTLLGMPNPWLWGALGGALNFIPYVGATIGAVVIGAVAFVTFDGVGRALAAPLVFLMLTAIEGTMVTPMILGQRFSINPAVVIIWLFLWGWIWGIGGVMLAIPMLATFKIFCDQIEQLAPVGRLIER